MESLSISSPTDLYKSLILTWEAKWEYKSLTSSKVFRHSSCGQRYFLNVTLSIRRSAISSVGTVACETSMTREFCCPLRIDRDYLLSVSKSGEFTERRCKAWLVTLTCFLIICVLIRAILMTALASFPCYLIIKMAAVPFLIKFYELSGVDKAIEGLHREKSA